jgi:hypothetical protein
MPVVSVRNDQAPLAVITGVSFTRQYHQSPYEVVLRQIVSLCMVVSPV